MSLKGWWNGVTLKVEPEAEDVPGYVDMIPLDLDARDAPDEVRDAAKTVLDWLTEEVDETVETIEITRDQWEGLQFELSELKSQMTDVQDWFATQQERSVSAPEPFSLANDLYDQEFEDWTLDDDWNERVAVDVTIRGGPEGLYMGPFVLLGPEERDAIVQHQEEALQAMVKLKDEHFRIMNDRHREREADLEATIKHRNSELEELRELLAEGNRRQMRQTQDAEPSWADIGWGPE